MPVKRAPYYEVLLRSDPAKAGETPVKRRRYVGELAVPIISPDPPTFEGAVTRERVQKFWRNHRKHERKAEQLIKQKISQKMGLLMKHYGNSDPNDMSALALALAFAHVPGFKIVPETKTKKGRKRIWDGPRLLELFETVEMFKSKHNFTEKIALKFMVNNEQYAAVWGLPPTHKGSKEQWIETLQSRLQDAKRYVRRREIFLQWGGTRTQRRSGRCSGIARRPFFRNFNCAY
jgi:hypothetical protein